MIDIIPIIIAYLLGSVPFGILVTRLAGKGDIRKYGSGNIGATNVTRVCGFKYAVLVYIGDIGKAVLAVLIAKWMYTAFNLTLIQPDLLYVLTAAACVLGSVFSVFLKFKGGKGVNTALGSVLTLMPYESIIGFLMFLFVAAIFRYISLGSVIGALTFFIIVAVQKFYLHQDISTVFVCLSFVLVSLIVITHLKNIKRIFKGTENKFSFSSKKKEANQHV